MTMTKWLRVAGVAGLLMVAGLLVPAHSEDKPKDKKKAETPSIEQIMEEAHGEGGLRMQIAKAVRSDKLADANKSAEKWVKLASQLAEQKPPRGKMDSWKKHCDSYEKQVKNVAAAVKSEKKQSAVDALNTINRSCVGCHGAHQEP